MHTVTRSRAARSGFSLVELIVILALSTIVMGGLTSVLVRQQRFYRGTADLIETRSQIRQAAGIIPSDLRGVSTIGGDILAISDTSMIFWATIGQAVACTATPGAVTIDIPPLKLANNNTLASFTMTPGLGDTVWVYHDGLTEAASDDQWKAYGIAGPPVTSVLPCLQLTGAADATAARYSFPLSAALGANLSIGTPLRFVRRTRYTLYKAQDNSWYLGYCSPDCIGNPQPIAGPFLPAGGGTAGVSFSYQNAAGAITAVPADVAQVSIVVRGRTQGVVDMGGYKNTYVGDSLRFSVAIRNRQ
ncbi:MAG: prepilin-type N-terminal cleavage/methylation domain-containing protein [Gemmatimonadaceae bacterium]